MSYRNITNSGDILFDFDLLGQTFTYQMDNSLFDVNSDITFLKKYSTIDNFTFETGYKKAETLSTQKVERQYVYDGTQTEFDIDHYDESAKLTDLWLRVYKNNDIQKLGVDYTTTQDVNNVKQIVFTKNLNVNDVILIKTKSETEKNNNGT